MGSDVQTEMQVLLRDDQRRAHIAQFTDQLPDPVHDDGGQPFGRFIQQQHVGIAHQRARDGEQLLLTARKTSGHAPLHPGKDREHLPHSRQRPVRASIGAGFGADQQIVLNRVLRKHLTILWHIANAGPGNPVCGPAGNGGTTQGNAPLGRWCEADDRLHGGRLAGPVAPQQCQRLALVQIERHPEQDLAGTVEHVDTFDGQQSSHAGTFLWAELPR